MRYKQLQAARELLIGAATYLADNRAMSDKEDYLSALEVIHTAITEVREELKHPERFNLDGTRRKVNYVRTIDGPKVQL